MNQEIELLLLETLSLPQDSARDHRLVRLLRKALPEERFELLDKLLEQKCHNALTIIKSIGDAHTCFALLAKHLPKADASSVKFLLRLAVDVIGEKKLSMLIIEIATKTPRFWEFASYWIPSMVSSNTWGDLLRKMNKIQQ